VCAGVGPLAYIAAGLAGLRPGFLEQGGGGGGVSPIMSSSKISLLEYRVEKGQEESCFQGPLCTLGDPLVLGDPGTKSSVLRDGSG